MLGKLAILWIVLEILPANIQGAKYIVADVNNWPEKFENCGKEQQSPIRLDKKTARMTSLPPLKFKNYVHEGSAIHSYTLKNADYGLKLTLRNAVQPSISADFLEGEYLFYAIYFHWGTRQDNGSDHEINGRRFAAELQWVHYSKKYKNIKEAMKQKSGLVILSHVLRLGPTHKDRFFSVNSLYRFLPMVEKIGSSYDITPSGLRNIKDIRPEMNDFYMYGSIPAPSCDETVIWLVDSETQLITEQMLGALRRINLPGNATSSVRPLQNLDGRPVIYSVDANKPSPTEATRIADWI